MTYYKQRCFSADEERNARDARAARRRAREEKRVRERAAAIAPFARGVFYVNGWTGDDDNDGHSKETPFARLQTALDRAEPGAMIQIDGPVGHGVVETSYITITGTMMGELPHLTIGAGADGFRGHNLTVIKCSTLDGLSGGGDE